MVDNALAPAFIRRIFPAAGAWSEESIMNDTERFLREAIELACAASAGRGFADFKDSKPGDEALHKNCFACHAPAKAQDYVYTRYARTP